MEEEKIADNAFRMGEKFRSELQNELDKDMVIEVRGKGLMNAIVINESKVLFYQKLYTLFIS